MNVLGEWHGLSVPPGRVWDLELEFWRFWGGAASSGAVTAVPHRGHKALSPTPWHSQQGWEEHEENLECLIPITLN